MKRKYVLINSALVLAVLFSMLLQSVHSFEHLDKFFSEKHCHHKYSGKDEITHQHHPFDHCFACEFTFSNCINAEEFTFQFHSAIAETPYFFSTTEVALQRFGNPSSLRGPPNSIV